MSEKVQLSVDFGTTFLAIQKLRREMQKFVRENSRDYASELEVEIMDAKGLDKLLLQIIIKHKSNWQNDALKAHRRNKVASLHCQFRGHRLTWKFMCALVQGVRKVGIVGSGPGLGAPANPMHIIRTQQISAATSPSEQPALRADTSFGQRNLVIEDPATAIDDDRNPTTQYEYYNPDTLERRVDEMEREMNRTDDEGKLLGAPVAHVDRGKSFGRRRKQVPNDLEKGVQ